MKGVVSREHLPKWDRLCDDFVQEETREEALLSRQSKGEEKEENVCLLAKKVKGKKKSGPGEKDLSKARCYACNQLSYYAGNCPNKMKKEKDSETTTTTEVFVECLAKEFSMVSVVSSSDNSDWEIGTVWLVDSGTTSHMTGTWDMFPSILELGRGQFVNETHEVKGV